MFEILKGTPLWVYLVFGFLIYVGIRALKPRTIEVKKIALLPSIITLWSFYTLIDTLKAHLFGIWLIFILGGAILGWKLVEKTPLHIDKHHHRITLPGSWSTLLLVVLIFSIRYFFNYTYITHPSAKNSFVFDLLYVLSSGAISGIFIGRALLFWHKFKHHR